PDRHRRDRAFAAAADHGHGVAALNDLETVADGVRARAAGGPGRRGWALDLAINFNIYPAETDRPGRDNQIRDDPAAASTATSWAASRKRRTRVCGCVCIRPRFRPGRL